MPESIEPKSGAAFDVDEVMRLRAECDRIMKLLPDADRHTVWHTLLALRQTPQERLEWSLLRGRGLRANKL